MAQWHRRVIDGGGFDSHSGKRNISFSFSGNKAKRGVEFSRLNRNASRIRRKECLNTMFPLPAIHSVKIKKYIFFNHMQYF